MEKMSSIKKLCVTAICIALCYVLPLAFHGLGLGSLLSPMHIPVLLCGLLCGWAYGAVCGIIGPGLSCLLSGMPSPVALSFMIPELVVYGLASGLLYRLVRTKYPIADIYIALIGAMILGRIAGGIASALFYLGKSQGFTIAIWASSYFLGTAPGIVCHLIVIPLLVLTLQRTGAVPRRYQMENTHG